MPPKSLPDQRKFAEFRCRGCGHMVDTPMHELGCPLGRRLLDAHITDSNLPSESVSVIARALEDRTHLRREGRDVLGAIIEALCEVGDKNILTVPAVARALDLAESGLAALDETQLGQEANDGTDA